MALGKTAKRLKTLAEKVETIYQRLQQMHDRVAGLDDRIQQIDERVEALETQGSEQRAVLDAIAGELDIDPEAVVATSPAETNPSTEDATAREESDTAGSADAS